MNRKHVLVSAVVVLAIVILVVVWTRGGAGRDPDGPRPTLDLSQPGLLYADTALTLTEAGLEMMRQAQAIDPDVRGWVTFDSTTGYYTYSYRVWNRPGATNSIWHFGVAPVPEPLQVTTPNSTWDYSIGYDERRDALVWMVINSGPAPADWDSVSLWPSPFDIQPGDSLTGFSFTTPVPPATVEYYVQGFNFPPPMVEEEGFTETFTLFQNSLTGTTVGPGDPVGVGDSEPRDPSLHLRAPVPNPATGTASVTYYLPVPGHVRLGVHDARGRLVSMLADGPEAAGFHSRTWKGYDAKGRRVPAGVYFFRFQSNDGRLESRKLVVIP